MKFTKLMQLFIFLAVLIHAPLQANAIEKPKGIDDLVYMKIQNNTRYQLYSLWGTQIPAHTSTVLRFDYSHAFTMIKSADVDGKTMDACVIDINFDMNPPIIHLMPRLQRNLMNCHYGLGVNEVVFSETIT